MFWWSITLLRRNAPEKLLVTQFRLYAPTLISRDIEAIKAFRRDYPDTIIKPLFAMAGLVFSI